MRWQTNPEPISDTLLRDLADGALGVHTLGDIHDLTPEQLADLC